MTYARSLRIAPRLATQALEPGCLQVDEELECLLRSTAIGSGDAYTVLTNHSDPSARRARRRWSMIERDASACAR